MGCRLPGLWPARLPCPWDFPGKNAERRLPCPSPGDLPDPGIEPGSPVSPDWQADSLPLSLLRSPKTSELLHYYKAIIIHEGGKRTHILAEVVFMLSALLKVETFLHWTQILSTGNVYSLPKVLRGGQSVSNTLFFSLLHFSRLGLLQSSY